MAVDLSGRRGGRPAFRAAIALLLAGLVAAVAESSAAAWASAQGAPAPAVPGAATVARAPALDAPLAFAPLDTPLTVTGGFGEFRIGHFHAGFDFGTGGRVGRPVRAPLSGQLERVRASGVGYGRSLYLRTVDGRLIQFGHLDAFMAPVAAWVDSIQRASGQYEQDLWPAAGRFSVRAGQSIAWTGQSGAGGPHLHFEIRRGDTAFQPERAGLMVRDDRAPTLVDLTLEPLDDSSFVAGRGAPVTIRLGAAPDTVRVLGRVRAIVGARDGVWQGVDRMVPWLTRLEWGDEWLECRMDSISWATDMGESDYVYDSGRVIGQKGLVLWAPAGWRPKFFVTNAPGGREAGTIRVRVGDAPRVLRLSARDVSGNTTERVVVVAADRPAAARPGRTDGAAERAAAAVLSLRPGTSTPGHAGLSPEALRERLRAGTGCHAAGGGHVRGRVAPGAAAVGAGPGSGPGAGARTRRAAPATTPLRRAFTLHVPRRGGGAPADRVGLYRDGADGWELISWTRAAAASAGTPRPAARPLRALRRHAGAAGHRGPPAWRATTRPTQVGSGSRTGRGRRRQRGAPVDDRRVPWSGTPRRPCCAGALRRRRRGGIAWSWWRRTGGEHPSDGPDDFGRVGVCIQPGPGTFPVSHLDKQSVYRPACPEGEHPCPFSSGLAPFCFRHAARHVGARPAAAQANYYSYDPIGNIGAWRWPI
jgi:hypothetical protein